MRRCLSDDFSQKRKQLWTTQLLLQDHIPILGLIHHATQKLHRLRVGLTFSKNVQVSSDKVTGGHEKVTILFDACILLKEKERNYILHTWFSKIQDHGINRWKHWKYPENQTPSSMLFKLAILIIASKREKRHDVCQGLCFLTGEAVVTAPGGGLCHPHGWAGCSASSLLHPGPGLLSYALGGEWISRRLPLLPPAPSGALCL